MTTGQPNVGAIPVLQDLEGWKARLTRASIFLVSLGASALIFWAALRYAPDFGLKVAKRVEILAQRAGFLSKLPCWVSEQLFSAVAGVVSLSVAFALALSGTVAITGLRTVVASFALVVALALFCAVAVAATLAGLRTGVVSVALVATTLAGLDVFFGDTDDASAIAFFFLLLPAANALADWVSVSATRKLLQVNLDHRHGAGALIAFMAIDLLIGIGCLMILLAGLVGLLELWAMFATPRSTGPRTGARRKRTAAQGSPFG